MRDWEKLLHTQIDRIRPRKISGVSPAERRFRIDVHKIHTVTLLLNARARNRWLNDELLQV